MANSAALVKGPTGQCGPNAIGESAEEPWTVTGDNSSPTIVITPQWLRQIDFVLSPAINTVINNTVSPPTATLTFAANLGAGAVVYAAVRGRR